MTAKIIVICNQKGGCGKTTVSLQLAGTFARRGQKVHICDGDEQQSVLEILSMSPEGEPSPFSAGGMYKAGKRTHQELKKISNIYNYIIVDCPPSSDSPLAESALLVADMAIIPTLLGVQDVKAAERIKAMLNRVSIINPELQSWLLLNRHEQNTLSNIIHETLSVFGLPQFKTELKKRIAYAESFLFGDSVHVLKSKAKEAIHEIECLADEINEKLEDKKNMSRKFLEEGISYE